MNRSLTRPSGAAHQAGHGSDRSKRQLISARNPKLGYQPLLDTIARAFSRFAAPADDLQPLHRIDLAVVVGEVIQLYRLAEDGCAVRLTCQPGASGAARADEKSDAEIVTWACVAALMKLLSMISPDASSRSQ